MSSLDAHAKINLGLVVGPLRSDGLHEVATVLQRLDLADTISVEPAAQLEVSGFADDTLVRRALEAAAAAAGVAPSWRARIDKRIPVAAGLGGGSSDAAAALRLASELLPRPLAPSRLAVLARRLGSDVPFFLERGPKLACGDGTRLEPLTLPQDYHVVLLLPHGAAKASTASVYAAFRGEAGFTQRCARLRELAAAGADADLAAFPGNDLVRSPHAARLRELGAFRAEVSGAGPTVYGLFRDAAAATRAGAELGSLGRVWLAAPSW
jgi:4-diphosphocytidyl-2-C-methyl-D-erythritol kinase